MTTPKVVLSAAKELSRDEWENLPKQVKRLYLRDARRLFCAGLLRGEGKIKLPIGKPWYKSAVPMSREYLDGWNACLAEVERLNGLGKGGK